MSIYFVFSFIPARLLFSVIIRNCSNGRQNYTHTDALSLSIWRCVLVPLLVDTGIDWASKRAGEWVCMSECILIKQLHKNKINEKRNFSCYSSLTLTLFLFLIPLPSFIHSLTHSFGFPPFFNLPPSRFLSIFLCYCALNIPCVSTFSLLLWRWRGCEKNSWKHNEISLPFAISFGFHMVEIVSRICETSVEGDVRVGGQRSVSVSVYVCRHACELRELEDVWTCSRCHYRTANNLNSFWSGSYLSNSNGGSGSGSSNYIYFTIRHCFVSLCV